MKAIARPMDCSSKELYCGCLKTFNVTRKRLVQPVEDEDNPIYEDVTKKNSRWPSSRAGGRRPRSRSLGKGRGSRDHPRRHLLFGAGIAPCPLHEGWPEPTLHPHYISVERVVRPHREHQALRWADIERVMSGSGPAGLREKS